MPCAALPGGFRPPAGGPAEQIKVSVYAREEVEETDSSFQALSNGASLSRKGLEFVCFGDGDLT
jgi:hypothetical protein